MSTQKKTTNPRGKKISTQLQDRISGPAENSYQSSTAVTAPQTFIVQNVGRGYVCLGDIGLDIAPNEAVDLTYWNPVYVKASNDLRKALMAKMLVRIDRDEHNLLMEENFLIARAEEAQNKAQANRRRKIIVDGKELEAELANLNSTESGKAKGEIISSYGSDNDSISYAQAYEIAANDAKASGRRLSAREFSKMVDNHPGLVKKLIESGGNGSTSGDPNRGRATVRLPEGANNLGGTTAKVLMGNLDRDGYLAGLTTPAKSKDDLYLDELDVDVDVDEVGQAESIDLALDDDDEAQEAWEEKQKGQVRRKK